MSMMNKSSTRFTTPLAGSILALAILFPVGAWPGTLPADDGRKHLGVASCAASQCHGSATTRSGSRVLQTEYVSWTRSDPHSGAYRTLLGKQSQAIAARLGLKAAEKADLCLDCHADNVAQSLRGERFQISDGVGCESCHGGAGQWLSAHDDAGGTSRAASIEAGMYPADKVADKARLCLSCHLGTKNKFATHRLMAAGHPRLTFELDTFTELWRTAGRQPHYQVDQDYRERKEDAGHVLAWVSGVLADGRHRLSLVQNPAFLGGGLLPELGLFDCHACHRTMKVVRWQPRQRHRGLPRGMPYLNDSSLVMAMAVVKGSGSALADELAAAVAALHAATAASPAKMQAAAATLDDVLRRLQKHVWSEPNRIDSQLVLSALLEAGAHGEFADYVGAEQAFMAIQMLAFESGDLGLQNYLDILAAAVEDDERFRPAEFARLLRALNEETL
ncbi:MAG: multiheme c-type cytochrome [Gammaproteobacteria bacterium]|nr:multiheme c-type cytochrome [Gammaproteobacteria bacterium]